MAPIGTPVPDTSILLDNKYTNIILLDVKIYAWCAWSGWKKETVVMLNVAVILGSTRPGPHGEAVARQGVGVEP
jgi:hypothetical protein